MEGLARGQGEVDFGAAGQEGHGEKSGDEGGPDGPAGGLQEGGQAASAERGCPPTSRLWSFCACAASPIKQEKEDVTSFLRSDENQARFTSKSDQNNDQQFR